MNYKRLMKNRKAISPIFATLILIAIAVIAGVVVYMFTSGTLSTMTGGGTAAQERVAVQGVSFAPAASNPSTTAGTITVYAQNMASTGTVSANGILIKNSQGSTVATVPSITATPLAAGSLVTLTGAASVALPAGTYTATVTSAAGGNFVSQSFVVTYS
jgi:flagellin-like protein